MLQRKRSNKSKTKQYNNKTWRWCGVKTGGHCERYRCHLPSKCKGYAKPTPDPVPSNTTPTPAPPKPPIKKRVHFDKEPKDRKKLKLTKALANAAVTDPAPAEEEPN